MARLYLNPLNPIALREMKTRMRGPRTFALVGSYLLVLALFIFVVYLRKGAGGTYNYGGNATGGNFGPTRNFETGQDIFISVFLYLSVVVSVITPAICGGLVSREIEDRTYDMLVVTPLKGRTLIYGKLLAGIGYMILLLLAAFPLACVVFIFGGVTFENILAGFAIVLMQTVVFGIISLFLSGLFRHTSMAVIVTYGIVAILMLGMPIISSSIVSAINSDTTRTSGGVRVDPRTDPAFDFPKRMLVFNPIAALGSVLAPNAPYRPGPNEDLQYFPNSRFYWGKPETYYATPVFPNGSVAAQLNASARLPVLPNRIPLWQGYLLVYTGLGLFFLVLSMGVVKPLPRRPGLSVRKVLKGAARRPKAPAPHVAIVADKPAEASRADETAPPAPEEAAAPVEAPRLADIPETPSQRRREPLG